MFPETRPGPRRVVIVEDEGILALDIERHLRSRGYEICGVAADSVEAVRLVETFRPDLVLMDIRIQGERDGIETVTEIKQRFDVPVVYLTAHSDPNTIERAQRTSPMGYLLKPFKKPDLDNVVQIALTRSSLERKLKQREAALSTTLQCVDEAIFTTDGSGAITYANTAAERMVGDTQLQTRSLSTLLPVKTASGQSLSEVLGAARKGPTPIDASLAHEGTERRVVGTAAPLPIEPEPGVLIALRDLTEYVDLRRRVEQSERMAAMGLLAAAVAHEINNPLAVVVSNLGFALSDGSLDSELRDALRDARDAADRVAKLVTDLRPLTRPRNDEQRLMHVGDAIHIAARATQSSWMPLCALKLKLGPVPAVMGSGLRLSQVLINLIENACHEMAVLPSRPASLLIECSTLRGQVVISVTDGGPGVPTELRERIFEPFFTTRAERQGTGLGLLVARGIASSHGGTLELTSTSDRGSTFTLSLPARHEPVPRSPTRLVWLSTKPPPPGAWMVLDPLAPSLLQDLAWKGPRTIVAEPVPGLRAMLKPWEGSVLLVESTERGTMSLQQPFDAEAVAAFGRVDD